MDQPVLCFAASEVDTDATEYTPGDIVYTVAFGNGDPEAGGHVWSFCRSFEEDWGVCTVREIQRCTLYDGIASFRLHRDRLECVFDPGGAEKTGFSEVRITFELDESEWRKLAETAQTIFRDRPCFSIVGPAV